MREPDATSADIARRLRELPPELQPPFDWNELQRRTGLPPRGDLRPRRGAAYPLARRAVLLAAGLASIVAAAVLLGRFVGMIDEPPHRDLPTVTQSGVPVSTPGEPRAPGKARDSEPLLQRASAAERWLASEPDDEPVVQVSTYLAVTALEDRIASVDDQLSAERLGNRQGARVRALQLQRAQLVDSLAQVRYAELLASEVP